VLRQPAAPAKDASPALDPRWPRLRSPPHRHANPQHFVDRRLGRLTLAGLGLFLAGMAQTPQPGFLSAWVSAPRSWAAAHGWSAPCSAHLSCYVLISGYWSRIWGSSAGWAPIPGAVGQGVFQANFR